MSILSDFFIADPSPVPEYGGGESFRDEDKCQFRGLSPLQGGQFLAVLRGEEYSVDSISEFELVTPEDAEDWTMSVPQDMVLGLAGLNPDQIPIIAAKFAEATSEELGWSAEDFLPIVRDLSALARRAVSQGKAMYLWICL
jgi:hypothetical protein